MKIAILNSGILPVPAVLGGAVENLTDFYLEYNNRVKLHDITIYSVWDPKVMKHPAQSSCVNHYYYIDTTSFKDQFSTLVDDNMDTIIDKSLESEGYSRSDITDEVAQYSGYENAEALFADMENEIKGSLDDIYTGIDEELQEYSVSGDYKVKKDSVVFVVNGEDELLLDKGTLNEDGSITVNSESDGTVVSLEFELQQ